MTTPTTPALPASGVRFLARGAVSCLFAAALAAGPTGCSASTRAHLSGDHDDAVEGATRDMDVEDIRQGPPSMSLGDMRLLTEKACGDIDLTPDYEPLNVSHLEQFLKERQIAYEKIQARTDLHYLDAQHAGGTARLRVATLKSPQEAARDLHKAILEHGPGSWGVHRSNLAVLAPIASTDDAVGFAVKTKLACWGLLTMAGRDDTFVVPGGYYQL